MKAKELRIGDRMGTDKDGNALRIKSLAELCERITERGRRVPHVHVTIAGGGTKCLGFEQHVR